ncbi:MAG: sensor histidine kinase [Rhizobiaceae bacterium]|nr:sensor histidine kinase [Rhizobiaceae bacterium]
MRNRIAGLLVLLVVSFTFTNVQAAESGILELDKNSPSVNVAAFIDYYLDSDGELEIDGALELEFRALGQNTIDFGFTSDQIWMRFQLRNSSQEALERVLRTSARFMRPLEIFLLRNDSAIEQLLYNDETLRFGDRPLPELRFLAVELSLEPLETVSVYVHFGAGGTAAMTLEISSREEALTEQYSATVSIVIYAAILLTLILVNFFHYIAVRKLAYLVYVFYESFNVLYVAHLEGFTWQFLWPNYPQYNDDATPMIACLGLIIGNFFAIVCLDAKKYTPRLYKLSLCIIGLSALILFITMISGNRVGNQLAAPLLPISIILSVVVAGFAAVRGHYFARYFIVAWVMLLLGAAVLTAVIFSLYEASYNVLIIYKVTIAIQAIILSMGLADQVRRINNQYFATQSELIENLQGRLVDAKERMGLEKDNENTMLQLLQKSKNLAATSHDINQPIQSLRLALRALSLKSEDKKSTEQLEKTLDHMESVLGSALDEASQELKESSDNSPIHSVLVGALISDVVNSFIEQAREKSVNLKGFDSKLILVVRELALKRCLMNLVSNAINSTENGSVLIGARRRGSQIIIQVIDTGKGIDQEKIESVLQPLIKDDESTGHGLGLAIVAELCSEYDWTFSVESVKNKGSCFSITLPVRT